MYINPFIAGILFTVITEIVLIIFAAIQHTIHKNKEDE